MSFYCDNCNDKGCTLCTLQKENDILKKKLAESKEPCIYCKLPAADMGKCKLGFPGCGRADDMLYEPR